MFVPNVLLFVLEKCSRNLFTIYECLKPAGIMTVIQNYINNSIYNKTYNKDDNNICNLIKQFF